MTLLKEKINKNRRSIYATRRSSMRIQKIKSCGRCRELIIFDDWYKWHGGGKKLGALKKTVMPDFIAEIVVQPHLQKKLIDYIYQYNKN